MEEIFADVVGYEGLYKVSNYGDVYSIRRNVIMQPFENGGYLRVSLYKDGKRKGKLVHRLVAESYLGESPSDNAQVNHIDSNRKNNRVDNLEWCTGSENVRHAIHSRPGRENDLKREMSRIGKKFGHLGIAASRKPVVQINAQTGEVIATFGSAREAAKSTGASYKNISDVCTGKKKTHLGFVWAFAGVEDATTIRNGVGRKIGYRSKRREAAVGGL